jgi:hypothetical protein
VDGVRVGVFRSGAGHGVQRREFFDPSRHLFRVHLSGSPAVVPLMAVGRSDRRSGKSCARRVCRRRDCRRSRGCPENIRKPYAQATEPVGHTNSMRGESYYCRGLSSSVVAALSAEKRKRTLRAAFSTG